MYGHITNSPPQRHLLGFEKLIAFLPWFTGGSSSNSVLSPPNTIRSKSMGDPLDSPTGSDSLSSINRIR